MLRLFAGRLFPFVLGTLFCVGIFALPLYAADSAPEGKTLKILTYNIRIAVGNGERDYNVAENPRSYDAIAGVITSLDCDVVGLQEVDRGTRRSAGHNQIEELAKRTGMIPTFGAAIPLPGMEEGKPGEYGIAILSKQQPLSVKVVPLPGQEERRALLIAEFDDFVFFNTHFSLTPASRLESMAIVNAERAQWTKPVVLVGDFNFQEVRERTENLDPFWSILSPDAPTFPTEKPRVRLDYIFLAGAKRLENDILRALVVEEPETSDHRPVFVEWKRK